MMMTVDGLDISRHAWLDTFSLKRKRHFKGIGKGKVRKKKKQEPLRDRPREVSSNGNWLLWVSCSAAKVKFKRVVVLCAKSCEEVWFAGKFVIFWSFLVAGTANLNAVTNELILPAGQQWRTSGKELFPAGFCCDLLWVLGKMIPCKLDTKRRAVINRVKKTDGDGLRVVPDNY